MISNTLIIDNSFSLSVSTKVGIMDNNDASIYHLKEAVNKHIFSVAFRWSCTFQTRIYMIAFARLNKNRYYQTDLQHQISVFSVETGS